MNNIAKSIKPSVYTIEHSVRMNAENTFDTNTKNK